MNPYKKGFTFIELLVYIAVISVVLTSISQLAWNAIGAGVKNTTLQEVHANTRFISERIKYEIRNANGMNAGSSTFGSSPGVLSLVQSAPNNPTIIDLVGGNIRIKQGAAAAVNLNSNDTQITSLVFTNYTSADTLTQHIAFTFTIQSNSASARTEYDGTVTIRGSAEIRSN